MTTATLPASSLPVMKPALSGIPAAAALTRGGLFDLRAVPGTGNHRTDGHRRIWPAISAAQPGRQQLVTLALDDHASAHAMRPYARCARRHRRCVQAGPPKPGRGQGFPCARRDARLVPPPHIRLIGRIGRISEQRGDDASHRRPAWRRSRTTPPNARCAGSPLPADRGERPHGEPRRIRGGVDQQVDRPHRVADEMGRQRRRVRAQNRAMCRIRMPRPSLKSMTLALSPKPSMSGASTR